MTVFIFSVVLLAVLGILIGILLGVAGKVFAVETDERVEKYVSVCRETTVAAVVIRVVMVWQRRLWPETHRSMDVRLVEHR